MFGGGPGVGTGTSSTARWKFGPSFTTTPALQVFGRVVAPFVSAIVVVVQGRALFSRFLQYSEISGLRLILWNGVNVKWGWQSRRAISAAENLG